MKIAQVTPVYPPYGGGMGRVVKSNYEGLRKLNLDVVVFTPDYKDRKIRNKEVEALTPKFPLQNLISQVVEVKNATFLPQLKKQLEDFDLVHLHYPFFGTDRTVLKWKRNHTKTPLVVTYHMDATSFGLKGVIFKIYRQLYQRKIVNAADKLIASTFDYIKHSFAGKHFEKNRKRWRELPFGVDLEKFKPKKLSREFFQQYDLEQTKKTILFVGGMDEPHEFKGIDVLLRALKEMEAKSSVDFQGVFVGEGDLREHYRTKALDMGLDKSVNFVGYVQDRNLPRFYSMADVVVLPSVDKREAFGLVLLESMACGTPVVASDLPGVRTIAKQAGLTFDRNNYKELSEQIIKILKNPVENTRETVKKYSTDKRAKKLRRIYQNCF